MRIYKTQGRDNRAPAKGLALFGSAQAFHAFEQLRQVPNLLVRSNFTVGEIGGAVLQVDRTRPQIESTCEFGDEFIQNSGVISGECGTLLETNSRGIDVVDVSPVWSNPEESGLPGTVLSRLRSPSRNPDPS
jgi:hypothetical protein